MANYGLDELFRDLTGINITGRPNQSNSNQNKMPPRAEGRTTSRTVAAAPKPSPTPSPAPAPAPSPTPAKPSGSLSRGERNNNPGNIEDGPWARKQKGYKGSDGRFAIFDSPASGNLAQVNLLKGSSKYRGKSVADVIQTYAPLGDNSEASVRNYIGYVAGRVGIDPNQPVDENQIVAMASAMREFETGKTDRSTKFSAYSGDLRGKQMATNPSGQGVTPRDNIDRWLDSAIPPEVAASQGVKLPGNAAQVINEAPEKIGEKQATLDSTIDQFGQRVDVLEAATQAAQANQRQQKEQQVRDSRAINQEILSGTDKLKRQAIPIFEARERVADQLDKLATMNPLERGLRSIFDLNYDTGFLQGQLQKFNESLAARMYDFQYLDQLQGVALREIDRRYGLETSLTDLDVDQTKEDLALINTRLSLASQSLGASRDELATQSQLIVAQAQARENILSQIDTPTATQLMTQAQANGGMTEFSGVQFSYKELRDRAEQGESQQRTIRAHQMALAQGEISLANGIAGDLAKSLSFEQLESAAANGGVWNGVQLPQDMITAQLEDRRQRATGQAQDILIRMPGHIAQQAGATTVRAIASLYRRTRNMLSPTDLGNSVTSLTQATDLLEQLSSAVSNNSPPEVVQAILAKLNDVQSQYQKTVGNSILRSVGGDKQAAGYVESFVYGTPLNPGTAAEALTYFALKGGLPDGLAVSPEARQVFVRAMKIANENRLDANGKPRSFDSLKGIVQSELTDYAAQVIGTPRQNDVVASLPSHAKALGSPLGQIKEDWWRQTYQDANTVATNDLAQQLKTTPENIRKMMERMEPIDSTPQMAQLWKDFQAQAGQYNALEQNYILEKLDSLSPLQPGTSNVELFEELLYSPELHQRIDQTTKAIEGNSFGDFLLGPMSQGAGQQAILNYAGSVGAQASEYRVRAQTAAREANRVWGSSGPVRVMTILASIPQIGDAGADKLRPWVTQQIQSMPRIGGIASIPAGGAAVQEGQGRLEEFHILEALRSTKFDDPSMEAYRKAAIQHWGEYSSLGDSIMQTFHRESRR